MTHDKISVLIPSGALPTLYRTLNGRYFSDGQHSKTGIPVLVRFAVKASFTELTAGCCYA